MLLSDALLLLDLALIVALLLFAPLRRRPKINRPLHVIRFVPRSARPVHIELRGAGQSIDFTHSNSNRKEEQQ
jgi:hypothetical protein